MSNMKIGLPDGQPERKNNKNKQKGKKPVKTQTPKKKVSPENIRWRDNGYTISAKISGQVIYIDKINFNIQLKNGFVIKCKNLEDAKNKAILLFNS